MVNLIDNSTQSRDQTGLTGRVGLSFKTQSSPISFLLLSPSFHHHRNHRRHHYSTPPLSYISPNATRCVQQSPCTYNPIVCITWVTCSSPEALTTVSTSLPFVLTRAPNTCVSALMGVSTTIPFGITQFWWPPSTLISVSLDSACFLLPTHCIFEFFVPFFLIPCYTPHSISI